MITATFEDRYRESLAASIPPEHRAKKRWPSPPPQLARMESAPAPCPEPEKELVMNETPKALPPPAEPAPRTPSPRTGRRYSEPEKAAALAEIEAGASIAATARRRGIKHQTLALWCKAKRTNGHDKAAPAANPMNGKAADPAMVPGVPAVIAPAKEPPAIVIEGKGIRVSLPALVADVSRAREKFEASSHAPEAATQR